VRGGYTTANWTTPDPVANPTTLDAQGQGRVLYITGAISPTIDSLGITGGNAAASGDSQYYGGGAHSVNARPVISNCVFFNNTANDGGGIGLSFSDATLRNNIIISNTASDVGGGLFLDTSAAVLAGNIVSGNVANRGGGLWSGFSDATFTGNIIKSNTAAWNGGGLYLWRGVPTLINDVVTKNQSNGSGGGIYLEGSSPRLLHNTVAGNTSGDGSGVYVTDSWGTPSAVGLTNTVLVSHTIGVYVTANSTVTVNGVLWYSNTTTDTGGAGVITVTNAYTGNPSFTADGYHLTPGSAAIDRGVSAGVTTDIDGEPRDQVPDLGADEKRVCWVRLNSDPVDYSTVQAAVDASTQSTDIIKVAGYCSNVNDYGGLRQVVYISKTLTLRGGYTITNWTTPDPVVNPTTLDARGQGRVLYITGSINPTVQGFYITGGDAAGLGGHPGADAGGGVYLLSSSAVFSNNIIASNAAKTGGGLYLSSSSAMLNNNTVVSNATTQDGGGLYLYLSPATLDGNTIISNTASSGGGGLYLLFSAATLNGNVIMYNSAQGGSGLNLWGSATTFVGNIVKSNTATQDGGGLFLIFNNAILTNNVLIDNQANDLGSGLYIQASSPQLLHTTFVHNIGGDGSGICVVNDGTNPSVANLTNTILVNHSVGITVTVGNTATLSGVLWYGNTIANTGGAGVITVTDAYTGNPAFASDGYHLTSGSAAIDRGVNAGVATDIDGQARPNGVAPDLGADEYWPSAPVQ
jgi:fibronectin-binding autotransporter adhesin